MSLKQVELPNAGLKVRVNLGFRILSSCFILAILAVAIGNPASILRANGGYQIFVTFISLSFILFIVRMLISGRVIMIHEEFRIYSLFKTHRFHNQDIKSIGVSSYVLGYERVQPSIFLCNSRVLNLSEFGSRARSYKRDAESTTCGRMIAILQERLRERGDCSDFR